MWIKKELRSVYEEYQKWNTIITLRNNMKRKIHDSDIVVRSLSEKEKKDINDYWIQYGLKPDLDTFRWYYSVNGIVDPRYICEDIYAVHIKNKLNRLYSARGLSDKNLFELLFSGENQAKTIFRCCNGVLTDEDFCIINQEHALKIAKQFEYVVIKPTIDSYAGNGIICIPGHAISQYLGKYGKNYIVQQKIRQHESFALLNESSVNVVRMNSLLLNDKVYILDSIVRVGAPGSITDHKNIAIGIDENGVLKERGITVNGKKVNKLPNDMIFGGHTLVGYQDMVQMVKRIHPKIPQIRLIGWDLTTDENGNALIIEANFSFPGIIRGQDCNGPFFGELTDSVLKFSLSE